MLTYEGFDQSAARAWVRHSLGSGHVLAQAVLERFPTTPGRVASLLPPVPLPQQLDFAHGWLVWLHGRRGKFEPAKELDAYIAERPQPSDGCFVVEDEFARRGDPFLDREDTPRWFSYVGDHLLHWGDRGTRLPSELVGWGSAGYPTNAFLLSTDSASLGLESEGVIDSATVERMVDAVAVVVVSALDADTFLIWELPEPDR